MIEEAAEEESVVDGNERKSAEKFGQGQRGKEDEDPH